MKYFLYLIAVLFFTTELNAQEQLSNLSDNPIIKKFLTNNPEYFNKSNNSKDDILQLPFWDDFSDSHVFPNQELWEDAKVYINNNYIPFDSDDQETNTRSIGVATFDAIDSTGSFYEGADYEIPLIADKLTSKSINLNYPDDNTIYLSFYFRPQGLGDAPETGDSLILEFYAPESDTWNRVWFAEGGFDTNFEFVIIQISENKYLKEGFKFRFKNYITLGSDIYPSLAGNCDHWHIDYVYLNKNRNENDIYQDIAFNMSLTSLLKNYEAMPWSHYKQIGKNTLKDNFNASFRNNSNQVIPIDSLNFYIKDISGNSETQRLEGGTYNPPPDYQTYLDINNIFDFPENSDDFASFEFSADIFTNANDSVQNNTVRYKQNFFDCYAYDDGTAEAAYGLYGAGTAFGSIAYKFYPEKADELEAVRMYFVKTLNNASSKYFWLNVWLQGDDGLPESEPIYTLAGVRPEYENQLNKFHIYELEEPVALDDTFFVGWTQTTDDMLNIGFDRNRISNQNLYYNNSGEWIQSNIKGSIMIRPVFGTYYVDIENIENTKQKITLFPNPVNDILNFKIPEQTKNNKISIVINTIHGKEVLRRNNLQENKINTSNLRNGIYFLTIKTNNFDIYREKFIVIK